MGQIIINTPVKQRFEYEIEDISEYNQIKKLLDQLSTMENPALTDEDLYDMELVRKSRKNIAKNGTISHNELWNAMQL